MPVNISNVQSGQSIQSAITAASSGTTIVVYPGTYNESLMLKDGVNLHFVNGAILNYSSVVALPAIYDAYWNGAALAGNAGAITCNITGDGIFRRSGAISSGASDCPVFSFARASTINLECMAVENSTSGSVANNAGLLIRAGTVRASVTHRVTSTEYDAVLCIAAGEMSVECPYISGGDDGCENSGGLVYINCDNLVAVASAVNATGGNTYLKYFTATGAILEDGGNIFVTAPTAVP